MQTKKKTEKNQKQNETKKQTKRPRNDTKRIKITGFEKRNGKNGKNSETNKKIKAQETKKYCVFQTLLLLVCVV
jgi:hypothetical protein